MLMQTPWFLPQSQSSGRLVRVLRETVVIMVNLQLLGRWNERVFQRSSMVGRGPCGASGGASTETNMCGVVFWRTWENLGSRSNPFVLTLKPNPLPITDSHILANSGQRQASRPVNATV